MDTPNRNRRQSLAVFGGATIIVVALAGVALMQRASDMAPSFEPEPVIPGLAEIINNIGEVTIETRDGSFSARRTADGIWVIPEKGNFPANIAMVRSASVGMSELEAVEPRTAQPELFGRLGLVAPEDDGEAIRVVLRNREGDTIGDLLIGQTQEVPDPEGLNRLYVRRTGENQTWLARGSMTVQRDVGAWLDKNVLAIERDDISSATFTPLEGPSFTLSRASAEEAEYMLQEIPEGREISYPGVTFVPATALANFTFTDVRPLAEVDFTEAAEVVTETFGGLTVITRIKEVEGSHWVGIAATADADAEHQEEAGLITLATHGWAFEIPEFTAQTFLTTRDSLLAPPEE